MACCLVRLMRVGVPHRSLAQLKDLDALLKPHQLVRGRRHCRRDPELEGLLAWGHKPSGCWALKEANQRGLALLRCEDGFLRSVGSSIEAPTLSLVVDQLGIYYDATRISQLDKLMPQELSINQQLRAAAVRERWQQMRLSKFNNAHESPAPSEPFVLVVDQTSGDLSLAWGKAQVAEFKAALQAALHEHPGKRVVVKVHPDVVSGHKHGHFTAEMLTDQRIQLSSDGGHPTALLEQAEAVYVVTSQLGFEALLWGKTVHCFGQPFYSGWGLTHDRQLPPPWRGQSLSVEQLVHASLIDYANYVDPVTGQQTELEGLMERMQAQAQAHVGAVHAA